MTPARYTHFTNKFSAEQWGKYHARLRSEIFRAKLQAERIPAWYRLPIEEQKRQVANALAFLHELDEMDRRNGKC